MPRSFQRISVVAGMLIACCLLPGCLDHVSDANSTPPPDNQQQSDILKNCSQYPENSTIQLSLPTEYGDSSINQVKLIDMKFQWHGYRYWVAYTPYPDNKTRYEDPCIAASNDLQTWDTFNLPDSFKSVHDGATNSCISILYDDASNSLELWWRQINTSDGKENSRILRSTSTDGKTWTNPESVLASNDRSTQDWYSPSVVKKDGTYRMWYVTKRKLWLTQTSDCREWSDPICCNLDIQDNSSIWNIDIKESENGYEIISSNYPKDSNDHSKMSLYHSISTDGINWSREKQILSPKDESSSAWDNKGLYCGSFIEDEQGYIMLYSGGGSDGNKGLALTKFNCFQKTTPVNLMSAYGDSEAYHPSIVSFDVPWNGYKYWCGFSPYPHADDSKENPHVLASNDQINWVEPDGFDNPLDQTPEQYEKSKVYNSDPALFYNEDSNQLECWWRFVDHTSDTMQLKRRCTSNGSDWTDTEVVLESKRSKLDYISFSTIRENGKYKVWSIGLDRSIQYCESSDLQNWSEIKTTQLNYPSDNLASWHIDVNKTPANDQYEMVICANDTSSDKKRAHMSLYSTTSNDGFSWDKCSLLLTPDDCGVDNVRGLYKSCYFYTDGEKQLLFSYIESDETRGVGLINLEAISES